MQPLRRDKLAGKAVGALQHTGQPEYPTGRRRIGKRSQEQAILGTCFSIHDKNIS